MVKTRVLCVGLLQLGLAAGLPAAERPEYLNVVRTAHARRTYLTKPAVGGATARWKKAWVASWAALVAANALDAHSSLGKQELNPLLRNSSGGFSSSRAALLKGALGAGFFLVQWKALRGNRAPRRYKTFAIANYSAAGVMGAVAGRNYGLSASAR